LSACTQQHKLAQLITNTNSITQMSQVNRK